MIRQEGRQSEVGGLRSEVGSLGSEVGGVLTLVVSNTSIMERRMKTIRIPVRRDILRVGL
jgi:hypothetical protein